MKNEAAAIAAMKQRLRRHFSRLSLHPIAAALAEPAAFAAALSVTGSHAAMVAAPILRCVSIRAKFKFHDFDGHRSEPSKSAPQTCSLLVRRRGSKRESRGPKALWRSAGRAALPGLGRAQRNPTPDNAAETNR